MQALHFIEPRKLEWRELPDPQLERPDEALVRPIAVALCDLDAVALRGELPAGSPLPFAGPFPFGHEFVAEVLEVGDGVSGLHPGQRVVLPVKISCGRCERCRSGWTSYCTGVSQPAAWGLGALGGNRPGAFADRVLVPFAEHMMVPLPPEVDPIAATSAGDNVADAWRTVVPPLREAPRADVLVVGRASMGLYAAAIAVASGASRVDYLDTDPDRLRRARELGANPLEGRTTREGGYPIVVDASTGRAEEPDLGTALRAVAPGGICTSVFPGFQPTIPGFHMWWNSVRLHTGIANCRSHMNEVLELIRSKQLRPELVISEIVAWEDAAEALADPSLKPVVVRDDLASPR